MGRIDNEIFYLKVLINSSYSVSEPISGIYDRLTTLKSRKKCLKVRKSKIKKIFNEN